MFRVGGASLFAGFLKLTERAIVTDRAEFMSEPSGRIFHVVRASRMDGFFIECERANKAEFSRYGSEAVFTDFSMRRSEPCHKTCAKKVSVDTLI